MEKKTRKASGVKRELIIFFAGLLVAFGLVSYSVAKYSSGWSELTEQLHIVLLGAVTIYFLVLIFRLIFWVVLKLTS